MCSETCPGLFCTYRNGDMEVEARFYHVSMWLSKVEITWTNGQAFGCHNQGSSVVMPLEAKNNKKKCQNR
jgi:hypothetical protein